MLTARRPPSAKAFRAADLLFAARNYERAGNTVSAVQAYRDAIAEAERTGEWAIQAEALRRLAIQHHHRSEPEEARRLCDASYSLALTNRDEILAAEVLNTRGGFASELGDLQGAKALYHRALIMGGMGTELQARVEQNLGILANMQGDVESALLHYRHSLETYQKLGNDHGCAMAFHNLGMISADRGMWEEADSYYRQSNEIAERLGDKRMLALCLLNHSEVHVARQRFEDARRNAEGALAIFDELGSLLDKTDAYRVIGIVYRETGRTALAEARLRTSVDLAASTNSVLCQAEATRELALLYQVMGRNQDALSLLNAAHGLFGKLDARADLVDVTRKVQLLEETFLKVVRDWGQSIESSDTYTFGHCERVAGYAADVARALGLDVQAVTTIRLGAYLHDVGKIRVPHEVLNKPGRLTNEEFDIIKMHPMWGIELLEAVEFPWDIKPIIRWHHEKHDGTGYPDRLRGDEIPLGAAIIGIVDVYDALTTTRSYRGAMTREVALAEMQRSKHWWRGDIYEAFMASVGAPQHREQESLAAD
ncbi:MAG TPA: HD domain-containing phosphohydrolase [Gemmatimonadales bacterium]